MTDTSGQINQESPSTEVLTVPIDKIAEYFDERIGALSHRPFMDWVMFLENPQYADTLELIGLYINQNESPKESQIIRKANMYLQLIEEARLIKGDLIPKSLIEKYATLSLDGAGWNRLISAARTLKGSKGQLNKGDTNAANYHTFSPKPPNSEN